MKTKNFVIAMAIFGGVLFMSSAVNAYNVDGNEISVIKKSKVRR